MCVLNHLGKVVVLVYNNRFDEEVVDIDEVSADGEEVRNVVC